MRRIALAALVVTALMSPTAASAYSFGDWSSDQGYSPGDAMPRELYASQFLIDSLDRIDDYDWTTTPTTRLDLDDNLLLNIEAANFDGLTNLQTLSLRGNRLSSIEGSGLFNWTSSDDVPSQSLREDHI